MATTTDLIQQLYVAYYNRPADVAGLAFWVDAVDNKGATIDQVSKSFNTAKEYTDMYSGKTADAVVNTVYQNLFGRTADSEGLNFWGPKIASGAISTADLVKFITAGAVNADGTPNADGQIFANKVAAAEAFTTEIGTAGNEAERIAYANGGNALVVAKAYIAGVTDTASLTAAVANVHATAQTALPAPVVTNYALTVGVDTLVGGPGNDVFNGSYDVVSGNKTLGAFDSIDGGAGNNTLNYTDTNGGFAIDSTINVKNVQTSNIRSNGTVSGSVAGWTGLTQLNVSSIGGDTLTAAATNNVTVTDIANGGTVAVTGGNAVTVTANTGTGNEVVTVNGAAGAVTVNQNTGGNVTLGGTTANAGTVTVVNSVGSGVTNVQGGTAVSITNTAAGVATGTVTIGGTTNPSGAVNVVSNVTGLKSANIIEGAINVTGGSTISVASVASQPLNTAPVAGATNTNFTVTQDAVTVTGTTATTAVTVSQTAAVGVINTRTAQAGVTTSESVVFSNLTNGQTLTVGGLTFTAGAAGTNAAQTAAAFANLASGALQGNSVLGTYSGSFTGWSTGAASGTGSTTVVFTSTTANSVAPNGTLVFTGTGQSAPATAAPAITETAGAAATTAVAGVGGIGNGLVEITDGAYAGAAANTIKTVTVNGYAGGTGTSAVANVDNFVKSSALTSLSLANGAANSKFGVANNTATTLALTVNNLGAGSVISLDNGTAGAYKTLNIITAGKDSAADITATGVTALTVSGTNAVDLTSATGGHLGNAAVALKTVTVSGSAGVTGVFTGANVTDVNASATKGNMTVSVDAANATYEGGSGNDIVTVVGNVSKAISLGAGNNTLILSSNTAAITAAINGGSGTADTLVMDSALAATDSSSNAFAASVTGFERLTVTGATAAPSVDVAKLGNFNYVTDASTGADSLTVLNMASGGTLVLSGAVAHTDTVDLSTASTASNSLNIVLTAAGATSADSVTTTANANVTSLTIAALDTTTNAVAGASVDALTLSDAAATTIVATGNATLSLTGAAGNAHLVTVDASAMTGGLIYTAIGALAQTVKGGATSNTLTAHAGSSLADTLIGGAGNDTITSNAGLDILTGNGGNDTFVITTPTNVNTYATITDANVGDTIKFVGLANAAAVFSQTKVTLAATAVFQDYANAAVHTAAPVAHDAAWFQFGGDTYIVVNNSGAEASFANGTDSIVKLTGLVDLSHTSLATTNGTLLIG